ncbi:spore coat protein [Saccharibacillus qingshengii]|uniref:spore coat protein n=1 Tax=Saccharibacillus qingshengii TaxID=1763540 RepID=UPI0015574200|nr:spore coat protein [Saccharibacillus qingshengii]
MATKELALHEKLEIHELLILKTSCVTKAVAMSGLVQDDKLKALMEEDIENSVQAVDELKALLIS